MILYIMFDKLSDQECFLTVCLIIVLTYSVAYFVWFCTSCLISWVIKSACFLTVC